MNASALVLAATLAGGLQAGTYYVFACGVMPGLKSTDDPTFVATMQGINTAIVNPIFLATFLGGPALAVASVFTTSGPARTWAIAGAGLALATLVVTFAGNIPLNNALESAGRPAAGVGATQARRAFETSWVRLNTLRAVTSAASLACLVLAALRS